MDENTQSEGKDDDDELSQSELDEAHEASQEDEDVKNEEETQTAEDGPSSSSPDVRKRRSRKAD